MKNKQSKSLILKIVLPIVAVVSVGAIIGIAIPLSQKNQASQITSGNSSHSPRSFSKTDGALFSRMITTINSWNRTTANLNLLLSYAMNNLFNTAQKTFANKWITVSWNTIETQLLATWVKTNHLQYTDFAAFVKLVADYNRWAGFYSLLQVQDAQAIQNAPVVAAFIQNVAKYTKALWMTGVELMAEIDIGNKVQPASRKNGQKIPGLGWSTFLVWMNSK